MLAVSKVVCEFSGRDICKGKALTDYILRRRRHEEGGKFKSEHGEKSKFDFVACVGDGLNDYCAMTRLGPKDLALPRRGFKLAKHLELDEEPYTYVIGQGFNILNPRKNYSVKRESVVKKTQGK